MSWVTQAIKILDDGIFFQDWNELRANIIAVKEFPKSIPLGGDPKFAYTGTSFADIEDPVYAEINGTNVQGLTFELHFMGIATTPDTVTVELVYDGTTQAVQKTFTDTTLALIKSDPFSLPAAVKTFKVRVKAATGGVASPFQAYGFQLVQK